MVVGAGDLYDFIGTFTYMPANGQWRPMAPAVGATVTLTIMFFMVYAGVAVLRTFGQLTGNAAWPALETALLAGVSFHFIVLKRHSTVPLKTRHVCISSK